MFIHLPLWVTAEQLQKTKKNRCTTQLAAHCYPQPPKSPHRALRAIILFFTLYFFLCWCQHKDFIPGIKCNETAIILSILIQSSVALFHLEKLVIRMKNGIGSSKYKPVDCERLQGIIEAKRLETDALREKVILFFSVSCYFFKQHICYILYSLILIQYEIKKKQKIISLFVSISKKCWTWNTPTFNVKYVGL